MSTLKPAAASISTDALTVMSIGRKIASMIRAGKPRQVDPWMTAIDAIDGLDRLALEDIGAPSWVIKEVQRRQGIWRQQLEDIGRR